jgi:hypothetical protein
MPTIEVPSISKSLGPICLLVARCSFNLTFLCIRLLSYTATCATSVSVSPLLFAAASLPNSQSDIIFHVLLSQNRRSALSEVATIAHGINPNLQERLAKATHIRAEYFKKTGMADSYRKTAEI